MENQDIKRGVDFETRIGEQAKALDFAFRWWTGRKFNKKTFIFLSIISVINFIIIFPMLGKNFAPAFYSSAFFMDFASICQHFYINQNFLLSLIAVLSLIVAPINFYLFVRRVALRHEVTAFIATLLFILPNPFFFGVPILVNALIQGDGAHVVAISFIPLFLLYIQEFLRSGIPIMALFCAIGTAFINVISPFAAFNAILFYFILMVSEGFLGNLRIKFLRFVFLIVSGAFLSFFWYHPGILNQILTLSHVKYAVARFLSIAPLAIPVFPVVGALSFLIFDRREKLKPIFISLSLFCIYLTLFVISNSLNISGIFIPDRYLVELALASSFFLAILFVFLTQLISRNLLPRMKNQLVWVIMLVLQSLGSFLVAFFTFQGFLTMQEFAVREILVNRLSPGIGGLKRVIDFSDITAILAALVSVATFFFLFYIITKFPSLKVRKLRPQMSTVRVE